MLFLLPLIFSILGLLSHLFTNFITTGELVLIPLAQVIQFMFSVLLYSYIENIQILFGQVYYSI